jgi:hypothetical protein
VDDVAAPQPLRLNWPGTHDKIVGSGGGLGKVFDANADLGGLAAGDGPGPEIVDRRYDPRDTLKFVNPMAFVPLMDGHTIPDGVRVGIYGPDIPVMAFGPGEALLTLGPFDDEMFDVATLSSVPSRPATVVPATPRAKVRSLAAPVYGFAPPVPAQTRPRGPSVSMVSLNDVGNLLVPDKEADNDVDAAWWRPKEGKAKRMMAIGRNLLKERKRSNSL